jgi:hypothetical protein
MRSTTAALGVLLALAAGAHPVRAQAAPDPPPVVQELTLNDGSRLYGVVVSRSAEEVVFRTTAGAVLRTPAARVVAIRPAPGRVRDGQFFPDDPNDTRLFFAPTGRALRRGEVYFGVHEILMPMVQVGITNRLSIGGGTPLVFGFDADRPYWITPKAQVYAGRRTSVAIGLVHVAGLDDDEGGGGIAFGVATRELSGGSFTLGAGITYTGGRQRGVVLMLGGDRPLGRMTRLITENYLWRSGGAGSIGVRIFGDRLSADLAMGLFVGSDLVQPTPIVNVAYRF